MAKYSTHSFNQSLIKLPSSRNKPWLFASFKSAFFNPSKMLCEKKLIDCTTATCVFIRVQFLTFNYSKVTKQYKSYSLLNPVYHQKKTSDHWFHQSCSLTDIPFHIQILQIDLHVLIISLFQYFHNLFYELGVDIIRRKLMLVTIST